MKEFFEKIHHRVAAQCGEELYLSSYSFLLLNRHFFSQIGQKDEPLVCEKDYEDFYHQVRSVLNQTKKWDVNEELKAWNAALFREILFFFHCDWKEGLKKNLLQPWDSSKMNQETVLEFSSQLLNLDPNSIYGELYEILMQIEYFYFQQYRAVDELAKFQDFKNHLENDKVDAQFRKKRIAQEKEKIELFNFLNLLQKTQKNLKSLSNFFQNEVANPWKKVLEILAFYLRLLESFSQKAPMLLHNFHFLPWLDLAFQKSDQGQGGIDQESIRGRQLYNNIVTHLKQATACLVDHTTYGLDSFSIRDSILTKHILENILQLAPEILTQTRTLMANASVENSESISSASSANHTFIEKLVTHFSKKEPYQREEFQVERPN